MNHTEVLCFMTFMYAPLCHILFEFMYEFSVTLPPQLVTTLMAGQTCQIGRYSHMNSNKMPELISAFLLLNQDHH
jgi:hypothetical protein